MHRRLVVLLSILAISTSVLLYTRFTQIDLISDLVVSLSSLSSCGTCIAALVPLKTLANLGDEPFVRTFVAVCSGLGIQEPEVCRGAIGTQAPTIAHSLREISVTKRTAALFCANIFGLCPYPDVAPWSVPFKTMKPKKEVEWKSKGRKPLRVVHLSDLHIDRQYLPGSEANCTRTMCCRDYTHDPRAVVKAPAGPFGNTHCDSPVPLYESMLESLDELARDSLFTVFTGDIADHAVWESERSGVTEGIHHANAKLAQHLNTVYAVIGNHDIAPVNAMARNTTHTSFSAQWVFDEHAKDWERWIGPKAAQQARETYGCFSVVHPGTKLRVISINGGYWYKQNFWLYDSDQFQPDPNGILKWLADELQEAEDRGERAWLIGHMSSGMTDFLHDQSYYYDSIVQRYRNTIAASFFGHSHRDEFELAYSDYSHRSAETASSVTYIGPALTPMSGNPAFRIYDIDPDTYEVLDIHTYIANLTSATYQTAPQWEYYSSARELYAPLVARIANPGSDSTRDLASTFSHHNAKHPVPLEPLTPAFWHNLTEYFLQDPSALTDFLVRRFRGEERGNVVMRRLCVEDDSCRAKMVCGMRAARSGDNCEFIRPGLHIDSVEGGMGYKKGKMGGRKYASPPPYPFGGGGGGVRVSSDEIWKAHEWHDEDERPECGSHGMTGGQAAGILRGLGSGKVDIPAHVVDEMRRAIQPHLKWGTSSRRKPSAHSTPSISSSSSSSPSSNLAWAFLGSPYTPESEDTPVTSETAQKLQDIRKQILCMLTPC